MGIRAHHLQRPRAQFTAHDNDNHVDRGLPVRVLCVDELRQIARSDAREREQFRSPGLPQQGGSRARSAAGIHVEDPWSQESRNLTSVSS